MPHSHQEIDISFDGPAIYQMVVKGRIDQLWLEDLGGMEIQIKSDEKKPTITLLTGQVKDQAELMGILNSLYELHMTVLSVEHTSGD